MCFTGNLNLYGELVEYLPQSSFVKVATNSSVSSSYTFIQPSSAKNLSLLLKLIPTFLVTFSIESLLESDFINWSTTCVEPVAVSFITKPSFDAFVPFEIRHFTSYVSSFSSLPNSL